MTHSIVSNVLSGNGSFSADARIMSLPSNAGSIPTTSSKNSALHSGPQPISSNMKLLQLFFSVKFCVSFSSLLIIVHIFSNSKQFCFGQSVILQCRSNPIPKIIIFAGHSRIMTARGEPNHSIEPK